MFRHVLAVTAILPLLLICSASTALGGEAIKVKPRTEGESEVQTLAVDARYMVQIDRDGHGKYRAEKIWTVEQRRKVSFVEVGKKGTVSKLRLHYQRARERAPAKSTETHAVEGKSYVAEVKKRRMQLTDSKGKSPPTEQKEKISLELGELGRGTPLEGFLHGKKTKAGTAFRDGKEEAQAFFGLPTEQFKIQTIHWTVGTTKIIDGIKHVVFKTVVRASSRQEGFALSLDLKGELLVAADNGRPQSWKLAGAVQFVGAQNSGTSVTEVRADGTIKMERENRNALLKPAEKTEKVGAAPPPAPLFGSEARSGVGLVAGAGVRSRPLSGAQTVLAQLTWSPSTSFGGSAPNGLLSNDGCGTRGGEGARPHAQAVCTPNGFKNPEGR